MPLSRLCTAALISLQFALRAEDENNTSKLICSLEDREAFLESISLALVYGSVFWTAILVVALELTWLG